VDTSLLPAHPYYLVGWPPASRLKLIGRRGLPYGVMRGYDQYGRLVERLRWFQVLWPLKILTVLFHEVGPKVKLLTNRQMCHAIVGTVT
jgi:hypothetical protein